MTASSIFIRTMQGTSAAGPRVAVKDCIDIAGELTTVGSPAYERTATPAASDAACLESIREAGMPIVGKTNLHELCFGATGVNPWYGTPSNPFDGSLIPGGSSSGSAVAVATGAADVALGTDTAGSVRTPAACCGVVGYRPTFGRVSTTGVVPLAASLDTVGVLARTVGQVAEVANRLARLEPSDGRERRVVRLRGFPCDREIDDAVDRALDAARVSVVDDHWPDVAALVDITTTVLFGEAWVNHGHLLSHDDPLLGEEVAGRLTRAASVDQTALHRGLRELPRIRDRAVGLLEGGDVLALAAYPTRPPRITDRDPAPVALAMLAAAAGLPAIAIPVPGPGGFPASLQLVGRPNDDCVVLAIAEAIEADVGPSVWAR
ncbi:MAG: amidase [Chloroflexota bacterium]